MCERYNNVLLLVDLLSVEGGKWLFWPRHKVDKEWDNVARAFLKRELGPVIKLKVKVDTTY